MLDQLSREVDHIVDHLSLMVLTFFTAFMDLHDRELLLYTLLTCLQVGFPTNFSI
jgi:hypothetical protein